MDTRSHSLRESSTSVQQQQQQEAAPWTWTPHRHPKQQEGSLLQQQHPHPQQGTKTLHPMGGSFRGVLLKVVFELLHTKCPVQSTHAAALTKLKDMSAADLDGMLHRTKPSHPTHKPQFAWVWGFMTSERCTPEYRDLLQVIMDAKTEGMRIAPQHSQDDPLVKWLLQWQQTQRG